MKDISVVVPSYNSASTIARTLDSLLRQSTPAVEIIVVDSSDDAKTRETLALYESRGVRVTRLSEKTIPAIGRNIGARQATGSLVAFIDSDAYAAPDWIEHIREAAARGARVGGGAVLLPPEQRWRMVALAQYFLQFNEFMDAGIGRVKPFVPSVNLFCEKKLFEELGGFPEIRASEDVMFGLKAGKTSPVWFDPAVRVYHVFRENFGAYLKNQRMLGKYILVYRRQTAAAPLYRGALPALLLPAFAVFKFLRIVLRIFSTLDARKIAGFLFSLPLFVPGLGYWSAGFFGACFETEKTHG